MPTILQPNQRFFAAVEAVAKLNTKEGYALASMLVQIPTDAIPTMAPHPFLFALQSESPTINASQLQRLSRLTDSLMCNVAALMGAIPVDEALSEEEDSVEEEVDDRHVFPVPSSQIHVVTPVKDQIQAPVYANVLWAMNWLVDLAVCTTGRRMTATDRKTLAKFSLMLLRFLCSCPSMHSNFLRGPDAVERLQLVRNQPYPDYQQYLSQILTQADNVSAACILQALPSLGVRFLPTALERLSSILLKASPGEISLVQQIGPAGQRLVDAVLLGHAELQLLMMLIPWCESSIENHKLFYLVMDGALFTLDVHCERIELFDGPSVQGVLSTVVYTTPTSPPSTTVVFRGLAEDHKFETSETGDGLYETVLRLDEDSEVVLQRLIIGGFVTARENSLEW